MKHLKRLCITLVFALLSACGQVEQPPSSMSFSETSGVVSETETEDPKELLAQIVEQLRRVNPEELLVTSDHTSYSPFDVLFVELDKPLLEQLIQAVTLEMPSTVPPQTASYTHHVQLSMRQGDSWIIHMVEYFGDEEPYQGKILFLLYPNVREEPFCYIMEQDRFQQLRSAIKPKVRMLEPPTQEWIAPIQEVIEQYRQGTIVNDALEPRFGAVPEGIALPTVNSTKDFTVEAGSWMGAYEAVVPLGQDGQWSMVFGMVQAYSSLNESQEPEWWVTFVHFQKEAEAPVQFKE